MAFLTTITGKVEVSFDLTGTKTDASLTGVTGINRLSGLRTLLAPSAGSIFSIADSVVTGTPTNYTINGGSLVAVSSVPIVRPLHPIVQPNLRGYTSGGEGIPVIIPIHVHSRGELAHVIQTNNLFSPLLSVREGRDEQPREQRYNSDHNEQFDQRKPSRSPIWKSFVWHNCRTRGIRSSQLGGFLRSVCVS
jgi:hypothetical protein